MSIASGSGSAVMLYVINCNLSEAEVAALVVKRKSTDLEGPGLSPT